MFFFNCIIIFLIFQRLKDVQTLEELGDVYNHFLLYYGRDIPKMQNAAKSTKKRLKKIREVTEDGKIMWSDENQKSFLLLAYLKMIWLEGEEEELEIEEEEEQKAPDLKQASRRDMYSICQSVGLG